MPLGRQESVSREPEGPFEGGCHCGAVRFRVRLASFDALECNCSICRRRGDLQLVVSDDCFELLTGEDALSEYRFHTGTARHRFCRICGIHAFNHPRSHPDSVAVNARCLDDDVLSELRTEAFDGEHWEESIRQLRG